MPTTRSAAGLAPIAVESVTVSREKRKSTMNPPSASKPLNKKVRITAERPATIPPGTADLVPNGADPAPTAPTILSFDFEEAKNYLIEADGRFEDMFERLPCKPFEELEQVHPFRALATSIIGQQISWLAARSINHKFIRLYDTSIPEDYADYAATKSTISFFPSPQKVVATDLSTLRKCGLSGRKAEYILDLAKRFSDGRLSTKKLLKASDEELSDMLIQIYGVGKWTVDMFSIFSMRRPNILPVADLGVQRGLLRWVLSLHAPEYGIAISPEKLKAPQEKEEGKATPKSTKGRSKRVTNVGTEDSLPVFGADGDGLQEDADGISDVSSVPPAPAPVAVHLSEDQTEASTFAVLDLQSLPTPFTPSISKTLTAIPAKLGKKLPTLPPGMTVATLKSRLDPKKKVKGAILTPKEMEELTEGWKPYRSLGVYYMWALIEDK